MLPIAHRGDKSLHPENSLSAILSAAKKDFYGIEFDVRMSKDKKFFVIHDATLGRTTNMHGKISKKSSKQLLKCYLVNNEPLPRLELVLAGLKRYRGRIFLELKADYGEGQLLRIVKRYSLKNVILENFSFSSLKRMHLLDSKLYLHYNNSMLTKNDIKRAKSINCASVGCPIFLLRKSVLKYAQENSIDVIPYMINSKRMLQRAKNMNIKKIFADKFY